MTFLRRKEGEEVEVEVERATMFTIFFLLLPLSLFTHEGEKLNCNTNVPSTIIIIAAAAAALLMRPAAAARTVASSALGGWATSRQRRSAALMHSSAAALSPPRQRRGLPQPARAGARDAAMRELMSSRDDARADSLKSKAPLGKTDGN